jgi:hypothetical protein
MIADNAVKYFRLDEAQVDKPAKQTQTLDASH